MVDFNRVDLSEATLAISDAVDLVGVKVLQHGKRVAFMALETARAFGIEASWQRELFRAALIHDCGVSSSEVHKHLVYELDWAGSREHCERGYQLIRDFAPFADLAELILYHHTHWESPLRQEIAPEKFLLSNLIHLADRVDALVAQHQDSDLLIARKPIRARIEALAGSFFDPALVKAFLKISASEAFWLTLESHHLERQINEVALYFADTRELTSPELMQLAQIFARIVDDKSAFTAEHSIGVSRLACLLGRLAGLSAKDCELLEIAGLLHDIGKLRVPDGVLDKPGPLNEAEFAVIERHTFETWQILRRIRAFDQVAKWASFHHESITGSGYPFHRHGGEISIQARIVAVADVFQAMAQDRPYRQTVGPDGVRAALTRMTAAGHLDPAIVALVEANFAVCWEAATGMKGVQTS
ncbi:MAG: HD domain-containing protein [Nitrosomonas sp.]|nr:HD domain-containing protein [Nitrosomonas sp.]MDP1950559.1 HD domain-containing protein [Nitrosomonas sp.]